MSITIKFTDAVRNFFKNENPSTLRTMSFYETISIPYESRLYHREYGSARRTYLGDVRHGTHAAKQVTWYEARKFTSAEGPQYKIYTVQEQTPFRANVTRNKETEWKGLVFTKTQALAELSGLEKAYLTDSRYSIYQDAGQTASHFAKAAPAPGV